MIASDTTAEQRVAMVTRSADLGRHYGELTTEIQQLERDRALAERDVARVSANARRGALTRASAHVLLHALRIDLGAVDRAVGIGR